MSQKKPKRTNKKGAGRPSLPPADVRKPFPFKLSETEAELIRQAAKMAGKPVATWCRDVLLREASGS